MAAPIKRKKTFGSVTIDHFSPEMAVSAPVAINIHVSFEDAPGWTRNYRIGAGHA
jgi:hypothetical protein